MTLLAVVLLMAVPGDVDGAAVMAKMAANLEATDAARRQYSYDRDMSVWASRARKRISAHEHTRTTVLPDAAGGSSVHIRAFQGECRKHAEQVQYDTPTFNCEGLGHDIASARRLARDLLDDTKSRDAVPYWLLPFRTQYMDAFRFLLRAETELNGRRTYVIDFEPGAARANGGRAWKGTVLVDAVEYQPARIFVFRPVDVPGPDLRHSAFSVDYQRVAEGVWVPVNSCNVL